MNNIKKNNLISSLEYCIPEGNVAVLVFNPSDSSYYYYKTIKHRRKSFALSCDSE